MANKIIGRGESKVSVRVMSLVWDSTIPAPERFTLLALADRADEDGRCWPSIETLARKCGCGKSTIRRHLAVLETRGIVVVHRRATTSSVYVVSLTALRQLADVAPTEGSQSDTPSSQSDTPPELSTAPTAELPTARRGARHVAGSDTPGDVGKPELSTPPSQIDTPSQIGSPQSDTPPSQIDTSRGVNLSTPPSQIDTQYVIDPSVDPSRGGAAMHASAPAGCGQLGAAPPETVPTDRTPRPTDRCPTHTGTTGDGPCRRCAAARTDAAVWDVASDRRRLAAIRACRTWCDADGWRIDPANRHRGPLTPAVRCDHTPPRAAGSNP